nr:glycosyltransferase [Clostridia bacterium]
MKKVKVMHVLGSRNLWGAEKIASEICNGMPRSEFEMVYVSPDGPIRKVLEGMGVNYVPIDRMTPRSIGAAMKQFNPDIIHAHDNKASLLSYLSSVFRRNRPYIISHIHNSYPYLRRFGLRRMIDSVFRPRYSINIFCSEPISKYYEQYAPYFYKLHGRMVM